MRVLLCGLIAKLNRPILQKGLTCCCLFKEQKKQDPLGNSMQHLFKKLTDAHIWFPSNTSPAPGKKSNPKSFRHFGALINS